jgi:hypothetical protein
MIGHLKQSPTGAGRDSIVSRVIESLTHGEYPFIAARVARAEGLEYVRRAGDLSAMAMLNTFLRECAYKVRRRIRVR